MRIKKLPETVTDDSTALKQVYSFRYMGSLIGEEGSCDAEIGAQTEMAKASLGSMKKVLTNMSLDS